MDQQLTLFDYNNLDADTRSIVEELDTALDTVLKRTAKDIGFILLKAKEVLPHGMYMPWIASKGLSETTAWRCIQVAQGKELKSFIMKDLSVEVIEPPVEPIEVIPEVVKLRAPREVVEQFFADYPMSDQLSNVEIAKRCGVTEGTVRNYKKELFDAQEKQRQSEIIVTQVEEIQQENLTPAQFFDVIAPGYNEWQNELGYNDDPLTHISTHSDEYIQEQEEAEAPAPTPTQESSTVLADETTMDTPKPLPSEMIADAWKEIKREQEVRREQQREVIERLRDKGVELPSGKYSCIVIDPPWTMKKIERDVRPNQVEFDYPTMNEDELKNFPLPDMAGDNCHLYLWTTQKHLPVALRLAEHWGFTYQCLMTWVKNVGMTPFSWMYSTEHILFCTKGSLPLLKIGKRLDFTTKIREHSRKPDEFYDIVKEVSPGPRIDVFSREKRDGFDQYGNEVDKYASA